jgi:hypothetical protein
MRSHPHRALQVILFLFLSCARIYAAEPYGLDLRGQPVRELAGPSIRLVVLIFAASDCPISNRYIPEIARLNHEFSSHGVRIWWVFPNPGDTAPIVKKHNADFSIEESAVLDSRQTLVQMAHITITPEAAIFAVDGKGLREVYRGRIDDRYLSIGSERPQAQHHDLEIAIAAALAGKPIPPAGGPPVGCWVEPLQK